MLWFQSNETVMYFYCLTSLAVQICTLVLSGCYGGYVAQGGVLQISIDGFEILDFRFFFFLGGGGGRKIWQVFFGWLD